MNINIDINLKASEEVTNALLTLAAVLNNAVPIFDETKKVVESKKQEEIKEVEENFQEDKGKDVIDNRENNYKSNEKTNHKANEKSNQEKNLTDKKPNYKSEENTIHKTNYKGNREDKSNRKYEHNANQQCNGSNKDVHKDAQYDEISLPEIRELLAKISRNGKRLQVKNLIKKFGAKKLTDIPKDKYKLVYKEAKTM